MGKPLTRCPVGSTDALAPICWDGTGLRGLRLVGEGGQAGVSHCVGDRSDYRRAEEMFANVVETLFGANREEGPAVNRDPLTDAAREYDLILIGASRNRSTASRLVAPPTFERIDELETDIAVVDRH